MPQFNGHPSWNAWNVALWINNDYGLYQMARDIVASSDNLDVAAEQFVANLRASSVVKTPDGAPYTKSTVRRAIRWMRPQ